LDLEAATSADEPGAEIADRVIKFILHSRAASIVVRFFPQPAWH